MTYRSRIGQRLSVFNDRNYFYGNITTNAIALGYACFLFLFNSNGLVTSSNFLCADALLVNMVAKGTPAAVSL